MLFNPADSYMEKKKKTQPGTNESLMLLKDFLISFFFFFKTRKVRPQAANLTQSTLLIRI